MIRNLRSFGPLGVCLAIVAALCAAFVFTGCASSDRPLAPQGVYAGDEMAFKADTAINHAHTMLDLFLKWEETNRDTLLRVYPEVFQLAERVRREAPQVELTAIALRDAYKLSPTPDNKSKLEAQLRLLRLALKETNKYLLADEQNR